MDRMVNILPKKKDDIREVHDNSGVKVVPEDDVEVKDFKLYAGSDDDRTKIVDGEKVIESFHRYDSEDDDDEKHKDKKDQEHA